MNSQDYLFKKLKYIPQVRPDGLYQHDNLYISNHSREEKIDSHGIGQYSFYEKNEFTTLNVAYFFSSEYGYIFWKYLYVFPENLSKEEKEKLAIEFFKLLQEYEQ